MGYEHWNIEQKWQERWEREDVHRVTEDPDREKYYVLDMFPYPSGSGLHVGHPLGYIAADIFSRFKRSQGYNVLHPMGFDAFGLPAEQYAIQTGQHPAHTTENNIQRYRQQLDKLGFCFDWSRAVRTSDPAYYKWTQWIFKQLCESWYDRDEDRAKPIGSLIEIFAEKGSDGVNAVHDPHEAFSAEEWNSMEEGERERILQHYRLAFLSESMVNWCPALGTVLANEEVQDGYSERGGHPVERKRMRQWFLRITAYADRLIEGLERIDWTHALKEQQRNWIGRSRGARVKFEVEGCNEQIEAFTTRPDTVYGVTFMVLAPENALLETLPSTEYRDLVRDYVEKAVNRAERDRLVDTDVVSGQFIGAYAIHPLTGDRLPVYVGDYVVGGYGTGAVMAVPASDERDHKFARHFELPIIPVIEGTDVEKGANDSMEGRMINSGPLDGLEVPEAIDKAIEKLEDAGVGTGEVNYRLRDACFSRQRYWGEPFPVYFRKDSRGEEYPCLLPDEELPLKLPEVDEYKPTEEGDPPLARATNWVTDSGYRLDYNTMPAWAGSSWYFLRYMDPRNEEAFADYDRIEYWGQVDLYIGGSEHATSHLLYSRFWTKFLYDRGYVPFDEPFYKLINQGMILGRSSLAYKDKESDRFISYDLLKGEAGPENQQDLPDFSETMAVHVDVGLIDTNDVLDIEGFKKWMPDYRNATFICNSDGDFVCGSEVEKMSKSRYNVITPDRLVEKYGADTLRLYEMFLGPLDQPKPWDHKGVEGVYRFLRRFWNLFHDGDAFAVGDAAASDAELKSLHRCIKQVRQDLEKFAFNTAVSSFMICTNELRELKCNKREVLEPLVVLLAPFAPHIAEELWEKLGNEGPVIDVPYPEYDDALLTESAITYPVSFNGKMRFKIELPKELSKEEIQQEVLASEKAEKYLQGRSPKKVIVVPNKIVNVVV